MNGQDAREDRWRTVRLERETRDRLMRRQSELQVDRERYTSVSDAVEWLLDLADRVEAKAETE